MRPKAWFEVDSSNAAPGRAWLADLGIVAVAVYGGYFNGGLGILLLAVLGALGHADMGRMNGIKNFVSAILTLMAVAIYAASGAIVWTHALWMALGAIH
ncbi:TSUP family transporter, partial [Variovorax sp. CT11-76]